MYVSVSIYLLSMLMFIVHHTYVGNELVMTLLLDAGAKADAVNSVKKTAAQMAAFVGKCNFC